MPDPRLVNVPGAGVALVAPSLTVTVTVVELRTTTGFAEKVMALDVVLLSIVCDAADDVEVEAKLLSP